MPEDEDLRESTQLLVRRFAIGHSPEAVIGKPKSITVTIRDREENKSVSITVYGKSLNEVRAKIYSVMKSEKK